MALLLGVNITTSAAAEADPSGEAVRAEQLDFDFVSASDHPSGSEPTFETWTVLSWIAAATSQIKVATRVLGIPYRSPAMVAKMAESLDRLSGGRLILGLGGGYSDEEFHAFGLGVPSARDKVDGLREAIHIIRGLWSDPTFSFKGRIYSVNAAPMEPKPEHRIPIWVGTYGPRALKVTGELADGWIPSLGFAPADQISGMRDRIMAAASAVGREPSEITCAYNVPIRVDKGSPARPNVVSGGPAEVIDQLRGLMELGFTAMNFMPAGPDTPEQVELLGREIIPALRSV